jgi:hypothetical protein
MEDLARANDQAKISFWGLTYSGADASDGDHAGGDDAFWDDVAGTGSR